MQGGGDGGVAAGGPGQDGDGERGARAKRKTAEDEAEDEALSKVAKGKRRSQGGEPERRSGVELDNTGAESSKARDDKGHRAVGEVVEDMMEGGGACA